MNPNEIINKKRLHWSDKKNDYFKNINVSTDNLMEIFHRSPNHGASSWDTSGAVIYRETNTNEYFVVLYWTNDWRSKKDDNIKASKVSEAEAWRIRKDGASYSYTYKYMSPRNNKFNYSRAMEMSEEEFNNTYILKESVIEAITDKKILNFGGIFKKN